MGWDEEDEDFPMIFRFDRERRRLVVLNSDSKEVLITTKSTQDEDEEREIRQKLNNSIIYDYHIDDKWE